MKSLVCQEIKIIEKIIHKNNEIYLARFCVINSGGNIQWKLIEIVPCENKDAQETLLLEGNNFSFFISQPTRAPNF
jgi:hypothetical protein